MMFPFTRLHHSKVPPLPQEILECILGHCSPKELHACSLASSSFRFPAQQALFHNVTILLSNTCTCSTPFRRIRVDVDVFFASNARIASYIRHLSLILSSSPPLSQALPYLKGLKSLSLHAHNDERSHGIFVDWRVIPAPLTDALSALVQTTEIESLKLQCITHFPLAVALSLRHLIIYGCVSFDITTLVPDKRPIQLQSLHANFDRVLQTLVDLPFLDLSSLVRFDAGLGDPTSIETIQRILDVCAPTLQALYLIVYSSTSRSPILRVLIDHKFIDDIFESHDPLSLSNLTSLTSLTLPLKSPASLKWCTHTLLTLPSSHSILTLTLYISGPLPTKHSQIDCIALYTQIDALSIRKLNIDDRRFLRGRRMKELEDDDKLTLEELLPRLANPGSREAQVPDLLFLPWFIRQFTLGLPPSSPPPQVLPYLKGLKALSLYEYKFHQADWRGFRAPLTVTLSTFDANT
ncbi:hypothetical protein DXG01_004192 [Tephrocybe rancida]|nr:hypothetical protein DXG01_004192 [Tephrocybe rancida]